MSEIFKCVEELLNDNGVRVDVEELQLNHPDDDMRCVRIEKKILTLDFSEHDKVFEDKIAEQKNEISMLKALIDNYRDAESKLFDENKELKQRIAELESKEAEKPTKINLNDRVKVKLTPLGVEIYYHQYDEVNKQIKERGGTQIEPRMPEIDKDGYTKFALWKFMELYGEHIGMCKKNVIEPLYIELCQDEWKMRYNEEPIEKGKE